MVPISRTAWGWWLFFMNAVGCGMTLVVVGLSTNEVVYACEQHLLCAIPQYPFPFSIEAATLVVGVAGLVMTGFGILFIARSIFRAFHSGGRHEPGR